MCLCAAINYKALKAYSEVENNLQKILRFVLFWDITQSKMVIS